MKIENDLSGTGRGFNSIRLKIVSSFMIMIIPITLLGVISYNNAAEAISSTAEKSTIETIEKASEYTGVILKTVETVSYEAFAEYQDYLKSRNESVRKTEFMAFKAEVDKLKQSNEFISDIVVLGNDKNSSLSTIGYNVIDQSVGSIENSPMYKEVLQKGGKIVWAGKHPEIDKYSSKGVKFCVSAVRLIKSVETQEPSGIVYVDVKLDMVNTLLSSINLGNNSEVHLASSDGRHIYHIRDNEGGIIKDENTADNHTFMKLIEKAGNTEGSFSVEYKNKSYLMVYSKLGDTGFTLVGLIPKSILLAKAQGIRHITFMLVVLAALCAIAIGLIMAGGMGKTISSIIRAAGVAASGDLTVVPSTDRKDEFGDLTGSIAVMITDMRKLIEQSNEVAARVVDSVAVVSITADDVSQVSEQTAMAIEEIVKGVSSQAVGAHECVNKMQLLAEKVCLVYEDSKSMESISVDTVKMAQHGLETVAEMDRKVSETTFRTRAVLSDIQLLNSYMESVGNTSEQISSIARQMNSLINSTKAGDGTAVGKDGTIPVMEELKELARNILPYSERITESIKEIRLKASETAKKAIETEDILRTQNKAVVSTISVFRNITSTISELTESIKPVMDVASAMYDYSRDTNDAIINISSVSHQIAASCEDILASTHLQLANIKEMNDLAQQLKETSEQLTQSINKFKIV